MLAKYWKKIGLVIIIIACVFNVLIKLINKLSLDKEMLSSAQYVYDKNKEQNEQNQTNEQTENIDNQNERTNESNQRNRNVVNNNRQEVNSSNRRNNANN